MPALPALVSSFLVTLSVSFWEKQRQGSLYAVPAVLELRDPSASTSSVLGLRRVPPCLIFLRITLLFLFILIFRERFHPVVQAGLEFSTYCRLVHTILPHPLEHWDYRQELPHLPSEYLLRAFTT